PLSAARTPRAPLIPYTTLFRSAAIDARISGSIARKTSAPEPVEPGEAVVDADDQRRRSQEHHRDGRGEAPREQLLDLLVDELGEDRKSTRLNSSHGQISYAVFC